MWASFIYRLFHTYHNEDSYVYDSRDKFQAHENLNFSQTQ